MDVNASLALFHALLSSVSLTCAVLAVRAIRRRDVAGHRALMLAAVAASAVFLVSFVVRFVLFGFATFRGGPSTYVLYAVVFFTHEPIAVVSVPLVLVALVLGLRRVDRMHREVVGLAYPIWLYSLGTGVLLFALLYLWPA